MLTSHPGNKDTPSMLPRDPRQMPLPPPPPQFGHPLDNLRSAAFPRSIIQMHFLRPRAFRPGSAPDVAVRLVPQPASPREAAARLSTAQGMGGQSRSGSGADPGRALTFLPRRAGRSGQHVLARPCQRERGINHEPIPDIGGFDDIEFVSVKAPGRSERFFRVAAPRFGPRAGGRVSFGLPDRSTGRSAAGLVLPRHRRKPE